VIDRAATGIMTRRGLSARAMLLIGAALLRLK
jgi:hypothetical protein